MTEQGGTPNWIDRAAWIAERLMPRIDALWPKPGVRDPEGQSLAHLRFMAETLANRELDSETKACRWLGYLQGGLVLRNIFSLERMKALNLQSRDVASFERPPEREPPPGLLMSMALRFDHALGLPGFYDRMGQPGDHQRRLEDTLVSMRQVWEEVVGLGFYRPDLEDRYAALRPGGDNA